MPREALPCPISQSRPLHRSRLKTSKHQEKLKPRGAELGQGLPAAPQGRPLGPSPLALTWPSRKAHVPGKAHSAPRPGMLGDSCRRLRVAGAEGTSALCPLTNWAKCPAVDPEPQPTLVPGPQAPQRLASCTALPEPSSALASARSPVGQEHAFR